MKSNCWERFFPIHLLLTGLLLWQATFAAQAAVTLVQANFTGVTVPQYSGGNGPSGAGTQRLPCFFRATVSGLSPGTDYRYYSQAVLASDIGGTSSGSGNSLYVTSNSTAFTYTTSPGLSTSGTYGTFTTDSSGSFTGWFCFVPSSNAKFAPGNVIYPSITLNGGGASTTTTYRFALDLGITCLDLSTTSGATYSSAIYGNSSATAKNLVLLYDNVAGTGRPLTCAVVEDDGTAIGSVASFYSTSVNGISGAWGALIPNSNANGVRRIEQRSYAGDILGYNLSTNGTWPSGATTASPTSGAAAIAITLSDAPLIPSLTVTYSGNDNTGGAAPVDGASPYNPDATVTVLGNTNGLLKAGYAFSRWNTAADGSGASYNAGDTFAISSNTTLYAQWMVAASYTVTYNGNGNTSGTAPMDASSPYSAGCSVTVLGNTGGLARDGYAFSGWNTASDGSGSALNAGSSFTVSSNTILYATWSANPVITVSPTTLGFAPTAVNGVSASQTISVSGANLAADLVLSAPLGFSLSSDNAAFASSLTLKPSGGVVGATSIYVRFEPTALQSYSNILTLTSTGATERDVVLTGSGATAPAVNTLSASGLSASQATLNGQVSSSNNSAILDRGFYYNASGNVTTSDAMVSEGGTGQSSFSKTISGLNPNQRYYYRAYATNAIGLALDAADVSFYTLANTPLAPVLGSPSATTLTLSLATGDGNPATTLYAIQDVVSTNYIQADGSLGATEVYQTATAWSGITVSGLSSRATYGFAAKARNGAGTDTLFGPIAYANTAALPFSAGDLAVLLAANASANNTGFSIVELNTNTADQSPVQTIAINGLGGTAPLRTSGSASSTGYLANSADGSLLAFTAHLTSLTSGNINAVTTRAVGTLNTNGAFQIGATYAGTNGNQTRCATSLDNTTWFVGDQSGIYTNGATAVLANANARGVKIFGGTIYVLQQAATAQVLSTLSADGRTLTSLGLGTDSSAQDFYLICSGSQGSTFDVLYILEAASATAGTVKKFSLVNGSWTANGSAATTFGGFGLCAAWNGSGATLYATTGTGSTAANKVVKMVDTAGYNLPAIISADSVVTLYTAAAGATVKGIAFAPHAVSLAPSCTFSYNSGAPQLQVKGTISGTYFIQRSTNLSSWKSLYTNTPPSASFQFTDQFPDLNGAAPAAAFYRLGWRQN
jgi:hypothetical protein